VEHEDEDEDEEEEEEAIARPQATRAAALRYPASPANPNGDANIASSTREFCAKGGRVTRPVRRARGAGESSRQT
jgi:hypothetical protein